MNTPRPRRQHLLQKLYNREIFGQFIRGVPLNHEPARQLFNKVPDRLIFKLRDTLHNVDNHILMGVTRCGQLLLTYTFSTDPSSDYSPHQNYRYRLHFWAFRPGRHAAKVAEVQLFDGAEIADVLTIGIIQWPNVNDRLLVFGCYNDNDNYNACETENECKTVYITVTTLPSLGGCVDCRAVAASFDEEEMAANWDSGVGLTCLRHGLTAHTHFSVPYLYTLDPELCMASDDKVVINTASFLHVLSFSIEKPSQTSPTSQSFHNHGNISSVPVKNRLSYNYLRDNAYSVFLSDDWARNMTKLLFERSQKGDKLDMSELPIYIRLHLEKHLQKQSNSARFSRLCNDAVIKRLVDPKKPKQKWFSSVNTHRLGFVRPKGGKHSEEPDKVYDFKEVDDQCEPKFKLFRRRWLADKMYEYRSDEDADMENIKPKSPKADNRLNRVFFTSANDPTEYSDKMLEYSMSNEIFDDEIPPKSIIPSGSPRTPVKSEEVAMEIEEKDEEVNKTIRAIMADWETDSERRERNIDLFVSGLEEPKWGPRAVRGAPLKPRNTFNPPPIRTNPNQTKNLEMSDAMKDVMDKGFGHQPITGCCVTFTRRFIEIDQEITSTITDIEDDDVGTGFHCALPLSVHGSAYSQMEMISNQKAEKLGVLCAAVSQSSLDMEQFCFKVAESVCRMEGFKFWFCNDYDTEVIKTCPWTGDILGILFIRLNAENIQTHIKKHQDETLEARADLRNFYEVRVLYVWSPEKSVCHLEGYLGLKRVPMVTPSPWCPAISAARTLRSKRIKGFGVPTRPVRSFIHHVEEGVDVSCPVRKLLKNNIRRPLTENDLEEIAMEIMELPDDLNLSEIDDSESDIEDDLQQPISEVAPPLSLILDEDNLVGFSRPTITAEESTFYESDS